jgi:ankyrin repeat protein
MMFPEAVMPRFALLLGLVAALFGAGACADAPPDAPLIQAARTGSLDAIERLLDSGADVNLPGPTGDGWDATALQHAILARQPGAVRLLLERGADPNRSAGPRSVAPLLLAAGDTDPTFVRLLLAHGADPAVEDEHGDTPLSRAVAAGTLHGPDRPMFGGCRVETVRALLEHNPVLRLQGDAGKRAIWWARVQDCEGVLRLIGGSGAQAGPTQPGALPPTPATGARLRR